MLKEYNLFCLSIKFIPSQEYGIFEERYTFSVNLFQTKKYISNIMFIYLKEIDMTDMETIQVDSKTQ